MKTTRPYVPVNILKRIRKVFPTVNKVVDSKTDVYISVTHEDCAKAKKKDPANCAFANACARTGIADGAIINIGVAYLINGNVATRYCTSEGVAREIVSFDRHRDFAPGENYKLGRVPESQRVGVNDGSKKEFRPRTTKRNPALVLHRRHKTSGIRVTTSIG